MRCALEALHGKAAVLGAELSWGPLQVTRAPSSRGLQTVASARAGQRGPLAQHFLVWLGTSHARFGRSDFPGSFRGTGTSGTEY